MTRVHQALERARTTAQSRGTIVDTIEVKATPILLPDDQESEPAAIRTATSLQCPDCHTVQPRPKSLIRRLLFLIGLRAYRCGFCRRRLSRRNVSAEDGHLPASQRHAEVLSSFLPPADGRSFQDLIAEIAKAEHQQKKPASKMDSIDADEQTRKFPPLGPRPAVN